MLSCRSAWRWLSILLEFGKEVLNNVARPACIDPYPIGVASGSRCAVSACLPAAISGSMIRSCEPSPLPAMIMRP